MNRYITKKKFMKIEYRIVVCADAVDDLEFM